MTSLLAHRLEGRGETVLFLNGGFMTIASWEAVSAPVAASYRVLRCDFREPGDSDRPGIERHVHDVVRLLDALRIDGAHVVGASLGAEVALLLAALHPRRVESVVAVTATDTFNPEMREEAERLRRAARRADGQDAGYVFDLMVLATLSPEYVAAHRRALDDRRRQIVSGPRPWFAGVDWLIASMEGLDLSPFLGRIRCPTLVVAAERDRVVPLARSAAVAAAVPGAELMVVGGSGHAVIVERPRELTEILLRFLERVGDRRRT